MGEKFRKGFLKVMEPLEPYFETLVKTIMPVLKWFEKWIWLIGVLACLTIYIWKSIIHHYVDHYSIGQALSITFGEMLIIILKIGFVVLISWFIFWLLGSILITWMNQSIEKRKAAEAITAQDQPAEEHPEGKPNETQAQETLVTQVEESTPIQTQETPVEQEEEPQAQPEPIAQEPAVEQTETAEHEDLAEVKEAEEEKAQSENEVIIETIENTETKAKRHIVRSDSHGKALPLNIDEKSFRAAFIPAFSEKIIDSDYSFLVQNLTQIYWTLTDLGKVALLIHESGVLVESYASMPFSEWMVEFFKMMGRTDCPSNPDRSAYVQFWKSRIPFQQTCSCLMRYYVKAQNNNDIEFVNPNKKKQE